MQPQDLADTAGEVYSNVNKIQPRKGFVAKKKPKRLLFTSHSKNRSPDGKELYASVYGETPNPMRMTTVNFAAKKNF